MCRALASVVEFPLSVAFPVEDWGLVFVAPFFGLLEDCLEVFVN